LVTTASIVSIVRVTYILIAAEIAAYSVSYFYSDTAISYLGFTASGFLRGEFWTPVSSIFVHVDLFHLATNMLFLYIFGIALEDEIGPKKALTVFFLAGVLSLLVGMPFYSPDTHIVGASIAVSGLVGGVVVLAPNRRSPLLLFAPLGLAAVIYLIFNAFMLMSDHTGGVAYQSHMIGFLIGVVLGLAWRKGGTSSA
jgi:membrane associated rhomboid family serine protease